MIDTIGLRRGNIVQDKKNNLIIVFSINEVGINESWTGPMEGGRFSHNPGLAENDISPILLNSEWLERCGFTWDEENQVYSIQVGNALYLELDKDFDCAITPEDRPGGSSYVWGENKSVHRLQNLFYDLTGKQLEIKLP